MIKTRFNPENPMHLRHLLISRYMVSKHATSWTMEKLIKIQLIPWIPSIGSQLMELQGYNYRICTKCSSCTPSIPTAEPFHATCSCMPTNMGHTWGAAGMNNVLFHVGGQDSQIISEALTWGISHGFNV